MAIQNAKASGTTNHVSLVANNCLTKRCRMTFLVKEKPVMHCVNTQFSLTTEMANAKIESTSPSEILEIKNNFPEPVEVVLIFNTFLDIETGPKEFHEHYQNLALTQKEQEQHLKEINTQLYNHCLIPCDFYSCVSELDSNFNSNSNSDNDNNNSSSFIQNGNSNNNGDLNSDSDSKQYIALFNLSKEQELRWFSNNNEGIMPECVHNTDVEFNLRYPRKNAIKLKPHLCTCIDLKVKRPIEPNKKIAQAIFLPLVKIAQLVSVKNREELGITARGIQGFGLTDRIDVPVNMTEEKVINKREIISTHQSISIPPYNQYMLTIERKVKDQAQIFEAEPTICKSGEIELINLYIPAKNKNHIKILIYNATENIIEIPKGTTIRYLSTEVEEQTPNHIPDFPQLCRYMDITSQTIYGQNKCYLL
ncbi:hypothetical protein G9A89_004513 [Geosiphon pyriformis]|nr:hypothetical protein G9A89_004513 [Geosiphon pyriformis]